MLGTGAIAGFQIFPAKFAIPIFTSAVGAFLTLGILAGLILVYTNHKQDIKNALEKERIEQLKLAAAQKKAAAESKEA